MTSSPTMTSDLSRGQNVPKLWPVLAVVAGFWGVLILWMGGIWTVLAEYSYGWVIPMLCTMLLWERWRTRPAPTTCRHRRFGLTLVVLAAIGFSLWRLFLEITPYWRFAMWAFGGSAVILTLATIYLLGGRSWLRHFAFPVIFFLLAIPWPERFEWPLIGALTQTNASITVELLSFFHITSVKIGNLILIEPGLVGVEEACSGIRSFQSTLMVGLFLGELFRFTFWRRFTLVILGAAVSFAFNILRTFFLVWSCTREGLGAVNKFHDPAGWTVLGASFTALALLSWWLHRSRKAPPSSRTTTTPIVLPNVPPLAVVSLGLLFVLGSWLVSEYWFRRHEVTRVPARSWSLAQAGFPDSVAPSQIAPSVKTILCYDHGAGWRWKDGAENSWQAFLFEWDASRSLHRRIAADVSATRHQPEDCFAAAGMQLRHAYDQRQYLANGVPFNFKVYEFADRGASLFVFSSLWESQVRPSAQAALDLGYRPSTGRAISDSIHKVVHGDRGITGLSRVFKFGVQGPRNVTDAEAAFQQQLNHLVQPQPANLARTAR